MTWSPSAPRQVTTCTPGDSRGPKRLWDAPSGYVVRERGDTDGTVLLEWMCPVHGRFEMRVSRRDTPDEVACPVIETAWIDPGQLVSNIAHGRTEICGLTSPWSPGVAPALWPSSGEVTG